MLLLVLKMQKQLTKRCHIVVSPRNYEAIKKYGQVTTTFDEAISEILRLAAGNKATGND